MKKSLLILLSFLIFLSTSGFSVVVKYCPIKKKTTFSLDFKKSCCSKKGKKCCKHKKIVFEKIKDPTFEKNEIKLNSNNSDCTLNTSNCSLSTLIKLNTLASKSIFQNKLKQSGALHLLYKVIRI